MMTMIRNCNDLWSGDHSWTCRYIQSMIIRLTIVTYWRTEPYKKTWIIEVRSDCVIWQLIGCFSRSRLPFSLLLIKHYRWVAPAWVQSNAFLYHLAVSGIFISLWVQKYVLFKKSACSLSDLCLDMKKRLISCDLLNPDRARASLDSGSKTWGRSWAHTTLVGVKEAP